jgi:hypothetical protein
MADEKITDGGPAFPVIAEGGDHTGLHPHRHDGLSLRDYFAAAELQGICANPGTHCTKDEVARIAERMSSVCFDIANAMIKARGAQS